MDLQLPTNWQLGLNYTKKGNLSNKKSQKGA